MLTALALAASLAVSTIGAAQQTAPMPAPPTPTPQPTAASTTTSTVRPSYALPPTPTSGARPNYLFPATTNTIVAGGIPLHVLVAAIANRHKIGYRLLPSTPDLSERFSSRNSDDFRALNDLLEPDGLAAIVSNSTLYVGSAPELDAALHTNLSTSIIIPTGGVDPQSILSHASAFAPPGLILIADRTTNTILLRGTPAAIRSFQTAIAGLHAVPYNAHQLKLQNGVNPIQAVNQLVAISPPIAPNKIVADVANSQVLVYGTDDYANTIAKALSYIDQPLWQVFYSISIYEVDPDTFSSLRGIKVGQSQTTSQAVGTSTVTQQASPNSGTLLFGFPIAKTLNISAQLDEMESKGQAVILRRADVSTTNGFQATTDYLQNTGFNVPNPYTGITEPHTVQTGVTFTVTPYVGDNTITTIVKTMISNVTDIGASGLPDTVSRDTTTQVVTAPDDSIVISGLYTDDKLDTRTGIPPFNHLFFIGKLAQHHSYNHSETELVAVLTPHLVRNMNRTLPVSYPNIPSTVLQNGLAQPGAQTSPTPH